MAKMKGVGYGIDFEDFHRLITYWNTGFSLNAQLRKLGAFRHYKTNIQGLNIHFIRESGSNPAATSTVDAVLCLHGWPGSFWEFHKIIGPLKRQLPRSTDIVVPSLPGFAFSEYPSHSTKFNMVAAAAILKEVMEQRLRYRSYIISAGDWGSGTAQCLGMAASLEPDSDRKFTYTEMRKYYVPDNIKVGIVHWRNSLGFPPFDRYHFRNIVYSHEERKGGHFAALEQPVEYVANIERFLQKV